MINSCQKGCDGALSHIGIFHHGRSTAAAAMPFTLSRAPG
jgi:hypothetical protein